MSELTYNQRKELEIKAKNYREKIAGIEADIVHQFATDVKPIMAKVMKLETGSPDQIELLKDIAKAKEAIKKRESSLKRAKGYLSEIERRLGV
jgi:hypothetical protein